MKVFIWVSTYIIGAVLYSVSGILLSSLELRLGFLPTAFLTGVYLGGASFIARKLCQKWDARKSKQQAVVKTDKTAELFIISGDPQASP